MVSDLRAEVERLKELAELQKQAIDVSVPSIVAESLKARAERAEAQLADLAPVAQALRDSTREADEQLAAARKDSLRLDWLIADSWRFYRMCDGINRTAIDAAMTTSNHKTT